ncbi:hypothetical protein GOODEAATRI_010638, partial [Goodea atripinnis]
LSDGGWGEGGCGRLTGRGSSFITSISVAVSSRPAGPSHSHVPRGGCTLSIAGEGCCWRHVHTAAHCASSDTHPTTMRGCSSRSKSTQNQGKTGKRRRYLTPRSNWTGPPRCNTSSDVILSPNATFRSESLLKGSVITDFYIGK